MPSGQYTRATLKNFLQCFTPWSFPTHNSISVIQWLLNAETSHPTSSPPHRLTRFFTTLHSALRNPSRAVLQFYPTSDDQIQLITSIAQKAGFGGGIVVDYPNSKKARKVFLCLFVGGGGPAQVPKGLQGEGEEEMDEDGFVQDGKAKFEKRRQREQRRERSGKKGKKVIDKDWILKKKEVRALDILSLNERSNWFDIALPETRKRRRPKGLKIHRSETEGCFLILAVSFIVSCCILYRLPRSMLFS